MPRQKKVFMNFTGGLNVDATDDNLAENELRVADNVDLDNRGAISKRGGTQRLNSAPFYSNVEQLAEWKRNDGTAVLLVVLANDGGAKTLVKVAENGTKTDLQALQRPFIGYAPAIEAGADKLYFMDGTEYYTYDGTTVAAVTPDADPLNDLAPIKKCRWIVRHPRSFRYFAAGNQDDLSCLYFSEPNKPNFFKNTSRMYPSTSEGPITGLAVIGDAVVIFYSFGVYVWRGIDPMQDATWNKVPSGMGTVSPRTIANTPSSLTFLGPGGLYAVNPAILDYNIVMTPTDELVRNVAASKVTSIIRNIISPQIATAVYDPRREVYYLAYMDDAQTEGVRNNRILTYNWKLGAFTRYTGLQVNDFCVRANGDLLIGTRDYILKMNSGHDDGDSSIPIEIKTPKYALDFPYHFKKAYRLYLAHQRISGAEGTIELQLQDDIRIQKFNAFLSAGGSFLWGITPWGDPWGYTLEDLEIKFVKFNAKGYRFQVTIKNDQKGQAFTVFSMAFEFRPTRKKGERFIDG
jgi:hypothetical protein